MLRRLTLFLCLLLPAPAPAADAAPARRPNILFMIADDWGWQHAGAYGCQWVKTPAFDRIAREGVLFRNAFTSNPKCSPCRASILTGRNSWQLEEAACHFGLFPGKFAVFPALLASAGYHTGSTGKGWGPGDFRSTGFPHNPAGKEYNEFTLTPPLKMVNRNDFAKNFAAFLSGRAPGQPFCFWLGTTEPHRAYERDSGIRAGKRTEDVIVPPYFPDNDLVRRDMLDYAMEVEYGDQQFGRALDVLAAAGELDNTLIVLTSDHGMPFPRVKGQILEDSFHLPLAIAWAGKIKPGRVVEDFVNVRDFAPTFLEVAGVPLHPQITGRSLLPILTSGASGTIEPDRNVMLAGKERHDLGRPDNLGYPVRAIRTPEFLFVHNYEPDRWPAGNPETGYPNCDDSPTKTWIIENKGKAWDLAFGKRPEFELYRITSDAGCMENLAAAPEYATTASELHTRMEDLLKAENDPRALGQGHLFDTCEYLGGKAHSYAEWQRRKAAGEALPDERTSNLEAGTAAKKIRQP